MHIDNKGRDILVRGKRPTQGIDGNTLTEEALYSINSTKSWKRFVLRLHYNGSNSFFVC